MRLCVYLEDAVRGFERYHRYAAGADLRNCAKEILFLIHRANLSKGAQRGEYIKALRDKSEDMKVLIYISKELKAFRSFNHFENASKLAVDVARQAQAWLNAGI
jgi:hypothetical protein